MLFFQNLAWAYAFRHIQPVEKFVLVTLAGNLPLLAVAELPKIAEACNLPADSKFERIIESLVRRGLVRTAPGPSIELCTWVNPAEWNLKQETLAEAGKAATNGR